MAKKEQVEFWDIEDMINYAVEMYPTAKRFIEETENRDTYKTQITRILMDFGFETTKDPISNKTKYLIPKRGAEHIIETILYDYFINNEKKPYKNAKLRKMKHHEKVLKDMEIKSKARDDKINEREEFIRSSELFAESFPIERKDNESDEEFEKKLIEEELKNTEYEKEQLKEMEEKGILYKLSNGTMISKDTLKYHLPVILEEQIFKNDFDEKVDSIINHVMLRAIFDSLFDFKEETFRIDLYERAIRTYYGVSGVEILDGYSELTRRLENPMGYYISPKGKKLKKEKVKKATDDNSDNNTVTDPVD